MMTYDFLLLAVYREPWPPHRSLSRIVMICLGALTVQLYCICTEVRDAPIQAVSRAGHVAATLCGLGSALRL